LEWILLLPYKTINDLPRSVRKNLPEHAQEIFLESFNNVWNEYKEPDERSGNVSREETAF
jgi:cation transport regulator